MYISVYTPTPTPTPTDSMDVWGEVDAARGPSESPSGGGSLGPDRAGGPETDSEGGGQRRRRVARAASVKGEEERKKRDLILNVVSRLR